MLKIESLNAQLNEQVRGPPVFIIAALWRGLVVGMRQVTFASNAPGNRISLGLSHKPDSPHVHSASPQRQLASERIEALLEDRRIREGEEAAHRSVMAERPGVVH